MIRFRQGALGMSLVEMLAVLFCIAILAALLIPAFASMKRTSDSVRCMNTVRSLGEANLRYASEYGHFINNMLPYHEDTGNWDGSWWWDDPGDQNKLGMYFNNVDGLGGILVCPAAKNRHEPGYQWMYNYLSYTINNHLAGVPPARVSKPHNKMMFMDGLVCTSDEYHQGFDTDGAFRHSGRANVFFVDGHCEARTLKSLSFKVNLGRYSDP